MPKHLMKYRLPEGVQAVKGAGAAQRVRLIKDSRNPLLLLQGGEGDLKSFRLCETQIRNVRRVAGATP